MVKAKITLIIDENVWKEFKKKAIDEDKKYSELTEEVMKKYCKKQGKKAFNSN